jgi:hypothetical protein
VWKRKEIIIVKEGPWHHIEKQLRIMAFSLERQEVVILLLESFHVDRVGIVVVIRNTIVPWVKFQGN